MKDVGEKLKLRLQVVLKTLSGLKGVYRNVVDIQPVNPETNLDQLPAISVLDGKESPKVGLPVMAYSQVTPARPFFWMPEVWVVLKPRDLATNTGAGEELSSWRRKVIQAVLGDETLRLLCGDEGGIDYRGYETDMQSGGECVGQMRLDFVFTYMLDLDDLVT